MYRLLEIESFEIKETQIEWELGEAGYAVFPADNDNPNYIAFLAALQKENPKDPHFVAWVEAGNDPEDFWKQNESEI